MKPEDICVRKLSVYLAFVLLLISISVSCWHITGAHRIHNYPKEVTFWMMPNGPIKEITPTKEEINEFAEKYDLKFEITDPSGEFPPHLGNGSHIVIVDLNIVDWASVISQTSILKEIDIFEKAHPDIKIKLKIIGWRSAHEEILKAASKKNYPHPDALQMPSTWTAEFADKNILMPLTDKVKEDVDMGLQQYYDCSLSSCKIEGYETLYAIPWFLDARVMYYWKDIFNEADLTEKDIKNWNALENACKALNKQFNGNITAFGIPGGKEGKGKEWVLGHNIIPWIYGSGGKMINYKPSGERELCLSKEKVRDGMTFYIDLSLNGYTGSEDFNSTATEIDNGFVNRRYAMVYSGPWLLKLLKDLNVDKEGKIKSANVGTALPPAGKAGTYTFIGGSNLAIWRKSGNSDEAWEFIKFLSTDKESQTRYANATAMIPASREALDDWAKMDPLLNPFRDALIAGYGRSFPSIPEWGRIENILVDDLNLMWKIVGNQTLPPDKRKSMAIKKLEEIDKKCYTILNGLPPSIVSKILFFIKFLGIILWEAIVGAIVGYALTRLIDFFKEKESKRERKIKQH